MDTYSKRKIKWEKQIEDVCVEMFKERNEDGFLLNVDLAPIAKAFTHAVKQMDSAKISKKYVLRPGNRENDD